MSRKNKYAIGLLAGILAVGMSATGSWATESNAIRIKVAPQPPVAPPYEIDRHIPDAPRMLPFFPTQQMDADILLLDDIGHWKYKFSGNVKEQYMRFIATGMLNKERLPYKVQLKMQKYGWNGYFQQLLKSKMDSDRFFREAAEAMDRTIASEGNKPSDMKLWELAIIETIHTLNIHSMERTV